MKHNLPTLSVLHYVYGALVCLGAFAVLLFIGFGVFVVDHASNLRPEDAPPEWLAALMASFGFGFFSVLLVWGILIALSGYWIAKRRNRTFSIVVAALCLLSFPIGTALGVFTLVVLLNDDVRQEYDAAQGMIA